MANSLPLPAPEQLAGQWQLSLEWPNEAAQRHCLTLEATASSVRNTFVLHTADHPIHGAAPLKGWRPTPDGVSLTDKEGATVLFLSSAPQGYGADLREGGHATLVRATCHP